MRTLEYHRRAMVEEYPYLIIGGAPKAGTTSLYRWLADHPQVCASSLKETRFFLDLSSKLLSSARYSGDNLQDYGEYFRNCSTPSEVRIDATPDYLFSHTALEIADLLPHSRILFVLRDPVERMVSWYKFARQKDLIESSMTFEDYINAQIGLSVDADTPIHLQALTQCCYENYLPAFRAAFGSRCLEIDFGELCDSPGSVISSICAFINIDDAYYSNYEFKAKNESRAYRNAHALRLYDALRRRVAQSLRASPRLSKILRPPNRMIKGLLTRNRTAPAEVQISDDVAELIHSELKEMLSPESSSGSQVPERGAT